MIYWPVVLFAVAAVGGATLAVRKFTGKGMPLSLAAAHRIFRHSRSHRHIQRKGALGGIYTGLFFASHDYSFVTACDMPFLSKDFIVYLTEQVDKYDIVVPQLSDGFQPLHAVYSQNCLSPIKRLLIAGKLKITGFYKEMRLLSIPEENIKPFNKDGRLFLNINRPEYLKYIVKN